MLGRRERTQPELFVAGSLRELLPDEHVLVRVDRVLDLGWLRGQVEPLYSPAAESPGPRCRRARPPPARAARRPLQRPSLNTLW